NRMRVHYAIGVAGYLLAMGCGSTSRFDAPEDSGVAEVGTEADVPASKDVPALLDAGSDRPEVMDDAATGDAGAGDVTRSDRPAPVCDGFTVQDLAAVGTVTARGVDLTGELTEGGSSLMTDTCPTLGNVAVFRYVVPTAGRYTASTDNP